MTNNDLNAALKPFLKSLRHRFGEIERPPRPADPIDELVWSYLLWESTAARADHALKRILASVVDFNELRVSLPGEICVMLGERYPLVQERSVRLRASLDDIFRCENTVSLARLKQLGKRDARRSLNSIDAIPSFVAARVALLSCGGHAIPLDQRTLDRMIHEGLFDADATIEEASGQLARHIKAADAVEAHLLIQMWAESAPVKTPPHTASKKKPSARPHVTKKKTTTRKKTTHSKKKKKQIHR